MFSDHLYFEGVKLQLKSTRTPCVSVRSGQSGIWSTTTTKVSLHSPASRIKCAFWSLALSYEIIDLSHSWTEACASFRPVASLVSNHGPFTSWHHHMHDLHNMAFIYSSHNLLVVRMWVARELEKYGGMERAVVANDKYCCRVLGAGHHDSIRLMSQATLINSQQHWGGREKQRCNKVTDHSRLKALKWKRTREGVSGRR